MVAAEELAERGKPKPKRNEHGEDPQEENEGHKKHFAPRAENGTEVRGQKHGDATRSEKRRDTREKCRHKRSADKYIHERYTPHPPEGRRLGVMVSVGLASSETTLR